jgi:hypothetical protein
MSFRLFGLCTALCFFLHDCGGSSRFAPAKPDATKGAVTGTVICADTGKPARFATVELVSSPTGSSAAPSNEQESAVTGLDGKFRIDGVPPGDYFALATLDGYLNPTYGVDFNRAGANATDAQQTANLIEQWKDHMVEVSVAAQHTTDLPIEIERGAEITGTVAYDDGSPAVGIRFALYRKNAKVGWVTVGMSAENSFPLDEKSGARGRFDIANLSAGEYVLCALLPADNQANSPQFCLGNTFRKRDAATLSMTPGDVMSGVDIVIPLNAIHSVGGSIVQAVNNRPVSHAKVHLLYADDREEAMSMDMFSDGTFLLPFVPQGSYILQVTDAALDGLASLATAPDQSSNQAPKAQPLAPREVPITVDQDLSNLQIALVEATPSQPSPQ